jgi:hypothetical protein
MKNCFITKNARLNHESSLKSSKVFRKQSQDFLNYEREEGTGKMVVERSRPGARDGHSANLVETADSSQILVVFGGDRHNMPYNDLYLLDFTAEISRNSELLTKL